MKQNNIIEPCCINTQLPQLMKSAKQGVFYSNGDWGIKKLMQAVSYMVDQQATVVLLMPCVDVYFCRMIRDWLTRGWMECLVLATKENCTALIKTEFSGLEDKVLYVCRKNLSTEAFIRYNAAQRLAIFGPLRIDNTNDFCTYSYVCRCSLAEYAEVVSPLVSLFSSKTQMAKKVKCKAITDWLTRAFLPKEESTNAQSKN
jgi:hypothetical protein